MISFTCECPVVVKNIHIQFQGGFAGKDCKLEIQPTGNGGVISTDFYPEDGNQMQVILVESILRYVGGEYYFCISMFGINQALS